MLLTKSKQIEKTTFKAATNSSYRNYRAHEKLSVGLSSITNGNQFINPKMKLKWKD